MSDVQITVHDDATKALERLEPAKILPRLARVIDYQNQLTVAHIQRDYLSLPKDGPTSMDGCRVITNRLRGSIRAQKSTLDGNGIRSSIGSNVVYAHILEEGGNTPPHKIVARNAKALAFNGIFRRSVNHPGSHIEGRHYVRRGIADRIQVYNRALSLTILASDAAIGGEP